MCTLHHTCIIEVLQLSKLYRESDLLDVELVMQNRSKGAINSTVTAHELGSCGLTRDNYLWLTCANV